MASWNSAQIALSEDKLPLDLVFCGFDKYKSKKGNVVDIAKFDGIDGSCFVPMFKIHSNKAPAEAEKLIGEIVKVSYLEQIDKYLITFGAN
jgi:hypothetical protein